MKKKKTRKKQGKLSRVLAIVLAVLLTVGACGLIYTLFKKHNKWSVANVEYNAIFGETFETDYPVDKLDLDDNLSSAPYAYQDTKMFSNKRITKIAAPISTVSAIDENQYFTLWVIPSNVVKVGGKVDETTTDTFKVYLPKADLEGATSSGGRYQVKKWITIDLSDQYVYVGKNETLAFMKSTDPVICAYSSNGKQPFVAQLNTSGVATSSEGIFYSVWGEDVVNLDGKTISILGDSISTYTGISNDTSTNTTIGSNAVYYTGSNAGITNVSQTWWQQTVDSTGAKLLVNNSWSGSKVFDTAESAAYKDRCGQLHSDTGVNKGKNPDIIAVYIGINDFDDKVELGAFEKLEEVYDEETKTYLEPKNFAQAYAIMIHKMTTKYDKADIYVFTLPENGTRVDEVALNEYNQTIRYIADYFDCKVVDLAGIEGYSCQKYCSDSNHLHPNTQGMDVITDLFVRALKGTYGTKKK